MPNHFVPTYNTFPPCPDASLHAPPNASEHKSAASEGLSYVEQIESSAAAALAANQAGETAPLGDQSMSEPQMVDNMAKEIRTEDVEPHFRPASSLGRPRILSDDEEKLIVNCLLG